MNVEFAGFIHLLYTHIMLKIRVKRINRNFNGLFSQSFDKDVEHNNNNNNYYYYCYNYHYNRKQIVLLLLLL
jgi:hypothetical protein